MSRLKSKIDRRQFLTGAAMAGAAITIPASIAMREIEPTVDACDPMVDEGTEDWACITLFTTGPVITLEEANTLESAPSGYVAYDAATQRLQRLHRVRVTHSRVTYPPARPAEFSTRTLPRASRRRHGGDW